MTTSRRSLLAALAGGAVLGATSCATDRSADARSGRPSSASSPGSRSDTTSTPGPTTTPATAPTTPGRARFVSSGPTDNGRVALTFHTDGDPGLAQQMLDVMSARHVTVTAFVVGAWLRRHPDWAAKLLDAGHELSNHTMHHLGFPKLTPTEMTAEIVGCRDALQELTGSPGVFFRPSGTANGTDRPSEAVLTAAADAGYATVLGFDVDPFDYKDPGSAAVIQRTLTGVRAGSVVSLHFGHPGTIAALPQIVDGIRAKGLEPGTASRLLA